MKISLVLCPSWTVESPPYTLALLSAILRKHGHSVKCFDLNIDMFRHCGNKEETDTWQMDEKGVCWYEEGYVLDFIKRHDEYIERIIDNIFAHEAEVIGFTVYSTSKHFSYEIARRIKERDNKKIIIFGGPQCFKNCEGLDTLKRPYVDAVCFGEGDMAFPNMLDILIKNKGESGKCRGFGIRDKDSIVDCGNEELLRDLNALPYADYHDFDLNKYTKKLLPVSTSRGCLGRCKFCNESPHWKRYRFRAAENIYNEISYQLERYPPIREFWFNDSLINGNIKMLEGLCDLFINNNLKIRYGGQALIRPEMDAVLLKKMKKSGCTLISYGLESGSDSVLRDMGKIYDTKIAQKVIRDTSDAGIEVIFNIILGFPGEQEIEFKETISFVEQNLSYVKEVAIMPLLLLKGSYLYEHAEKFDIDLKAGHDQLLWKTADNRNNYDMRMRRFKLLKEIVGKRAYTIYSPGETGHQREEEPWINLCIELSSSCNLKCYMCTHYDNLPVHGKPYDNGFMDLDVWNRILRGLEEGRLGKIESITLYWLGESLLHPDFKDMLSQLLQLNIKKDIFKNLFINTNGVFFNSEITNIILDYAGNIQDRGMTKEKYLNIHFSLETLNPDVYKRIKGADADVLNTALKNIDFLVNERHRRGLDLPNITFGAVILIDNADEARDFYNYWKEYVGRYGRKCEAIFETKYFNDRDAVYFRCFEDISGTVYSKIAKDKHKEISDKYGRQGIKAEGENRRSERSGRRKPCFQLWNMFMISKDGVITPCCKDRFLELKIGDINNDDLNDILCGEKIKRLRLDHLKGRFYKYKICADCVDPPGGFLEDKEIERYAEETGIERDSYCGRFDKFSITRKSFRPLNICLVSREYPEETGWGGIGVYTYHLAHALSGRGHNVHVVCQGLDGERTYRDDKVIVHRLKHENYFYNRSVLKEFLLRIEYGRAVNKKIDEIVDRYGIDIVEGPNLSAETFIHSFFRKAPIVTRLHTHYSEVLKLRGLGTNLENRLACWMEDGCIKRSDMVSCSTRGHAEKIANEIGIDSGKIQIIPLGIDLPAPDKLIYSDNRPYKILFVGRLEDRKGPQVLVKAIPLVLKKVPDAEFVFIGRDTFQCNGNSYKECLIRNIPAEYAEKVKFLGHVDNRDLSGHFKSCDIFTAPSLYESFGFIYIEAMAYAKPVIGCAVGGVPEVIKDGETGILVTPGDHVSLANAIISLLDDENKRLEMGFMAREDIEARFSRDLMAKRTEEAYFSLLK